MEACILFDRTLLNRQERRAGRAIEQKQIAVGPHRCDALSRPTVNGGVEEHQRSGDVHLPNVMTGELIVPTILSGFQVYRDD